MSFSRGSSWPRDRTWVFRIVGRRFTFWVTREVCSFILFSNHTLKPYLFYKVRFTCFHLPLIILELLFSHWVMSVSFVTPWTVRSLPLCPWNLPGKNTRVGCHFLLQGIFPIQGLNLCLLNCQEDSLPLSQQGSTILELVVSFSALGVVVNIPL